MPPVVLVGAIERIGTREQCFARHADAGIAHARPSLPRCARRCRPVSVYWHALLTGCRPSPRARAGARGSPGRRGLTTRSSTGWPASSGCTFSTSSATMSGTLNCSRCGSMSPSRARIRKASITASMSRLARWMRAATRRARWWSRIVQQVGGDADHGERRAQLVARIAGEVALARDEGLDAFGRACAAPASCRASPLPISGGRCGASRVDVQRARIPAATSRASQLTGATSAWTPDRSAGTPRTRRAGPAARAAPRRRTTAARCAPGCRPGRAPAVARATRTCRSRSSR